MYSYVLTLWYVYIIFISLWHCNIEVICYTDQSELNMFYLFCDFSLKTIGYIKKT